MALLFSEEWKEICLKICFISNENYPPFAKGTAG
jgi:hypothetical protein